MLEIKELHASINGKEILKGINLTIRDGEVNALMGQNGAGKSTLSNVLVGHPAYEAVSYTHLKIAVESYDDRIDPVGACVGVKGSRIHGIVRELRNCLLYTSRCV